MRRVGIKYLMFLGVGIVGALLVAPRVDDPAAVVAALLPTLAGAYLAWCAYRADRLEAAAVTDPGAVADRLAVAVRRQWEGEARARRLADPYPLPVAWRGADPDLAEVTGGLAGRDDGIGAVFGGRVPDRRLLVLGDPGSGKTLLLVRLVLALIEERAQGDPVPVLFPLASWDPAVTDLRGWMERRLVQDHAELGLAAPGEYGETTLAGMLLDRRLVLPVLDGFDELPAATSGLALHRIAEALPYGNGLVLSSRPAEYRAALRPRTGVPARLTGMAGVRLEPLGAGDVAAYLLRDAGGSGTPAAVRWQAVVAALGTDAPVAGALSSPLMVSLARSVYNPRPGEAEGELPDPAELLRCPTRTAVERHLLDAFVDAAYRPHPGRPCRWTVDEARGALRFLARWMERGVEGAAEIAWWELRLAVPAALPRVLAGVLLAVVGWLVDGATMELREHLAPDLDSDPHWAMGGGLGVAAAGLCGGLVCGLAGGVTATLLCAAAAPDLSVEFVAARLADMGVFVLAGVVVSAFAFGCRPHVRRPSDWDWRTVLTGVTAAAFSALAYRSAYGTVSAVFYGVVAGAMRADGMLPGPARPVARLRWHWSFGGVLMGLLGGVVLGSANLVERLFEDELAAGMGNTLPGSDTSFEAVWAAEQVAVVSALACLIVHGLRMVPVDLGTSVDGRTLLGNDRRTLGACVLTAVALAIAVIGLQGGITKLWGTTRVWSGDAADDFLWLYVVGLVPALPLGLAVGIRQAAWSHYAVARCYLALRARLPYDLMAFLADAHEQRGVLRKVGAVYQFRHIELQHRLADPDR